MALVIEHGCARECAAAQAVIKIHVLRIVCERVHAFRKLPVFLKDKIQADKANVVLFDEIGVQVTGGVCRQNKFVHDLTSDNFRVYTLFYYTIRSLQAQLFVNEIQQFGREEKSALAEGGFCKIGPLFS